LFLFIINPYHFDYGNIDIFSFSAKVPNSKKQKRRSKVRLWYKN